MDRGTMAAKTPRNLGLRQPLFQHAHQAAALCERKVVILSSHSGHADSTCRTWFGNLAVSYEEKVVGASSTELDVSAVATINYRKAVFQAVSNYPVAIYKASTAFHDLAALDHPPALVSVVSNKKEMGSSLSLLAQAGRVIEVAQSDDVFQRSVA